MKRFRGFLSLVLSFLMVVGPFSSNFNIRSAEAQPSSVNPQRIFVSMKPLVDELMGATTDNIDSDGDGLPDSVENIIGTDPELADTDFDRLPDKYEIDNDLDPLNPDSNYDGLPDHFEVNGSASNDVDQDGYVNAWDLDNDGDGVNDSADLSPFARTDIQPVFHFDISTNENPLYINFQIRPSNPEHLKLFGKKWDWPDGDSRGSMKDLDRSTQDVEIVPVLKIVVNHLPVIDDTYHQNIIVEDDNTMSVMLMPVEEHGNVVALTARLPYTTSVPANLALDTRLVWMVIGTSDEPGEDPQKIKLVSYSEDFIISGMTVEEHRGTTAGVFYSDDINQTVAANLSLAYQFLRSSASDINAMSAVLDGLGVDTEEMIAGFGHKDAALLSLANTMIPQALGTLPQDRALPVVTLFQEDAVRMELSEFKVANGSASIDLAGAPVITVKTLKTPWYHVDSGQALSTQDMAGEIRNLSIGGPASSVLMSLMLYWNTGEQTLHGPGIPPMEVPDDYQLVPDVAENIIAGGLAELTAIAELMDEFDGIGSVLKSYQTSKFLKKKGLLVEIEDATPEELGRMGDYDKFKKWTRQCDTTAGNTKFFRYMDDLMEGIDIAAIFLDAGASAYSVITLAQNSDLTPMQLNNALLKVTGEYYFAMAETMIGAIPVVGWIIGLAIVISDLIGDWSQDLIGWIVDSMSDVVFKVTPDVAAVGDGTIQIDDTDGNGIDVGDRITYASLLKGTVYGTGNYWKLVNKSRIYPYYKIFGPSGSGSPTGSLASSRHLTIDGYIDLPIPQQRSVLSNSAEGWKSETYEAGAWIEPGTPMVNFPIKIRMDTWSEIWYRWEHFAFFIFYGFWCEHDDFVHGYNTGQANTIYVDVMPGSIGEFTHWNALNPLDRDGDGLKDSEETSTSSWAYDSDADGLSDKFEIEAGTDPLSHDSDGDGLIDWFEYQYGTDPLNADTDGDGLNDYLETAGWLIEFYYELSGRSHVMRVYSDPNVPDSDGDGIEDGMEYRSRLNPLSRDTNGDGVNDVAHPVDQITELILAAETPELAYDLRDFAVDAEGFVYALAAGHLLKFDADLQLIQTWPLAEADSRLDDARSFAIDDANGRIHVAYATYYYPYYELGVFTFDTDGYLLNADAWARQQFDYFDYNDSGHIDLNVDSEGKIYILKRWGERIPTVWYNLSNPPQHKARMEVYSADHELLDEWGEYGALWIIENPNPSAQGVLFTYDNAVSDLNDVSGSALNETQSNIYVCEAGAEKLYYEYRRPNNYWLWQLIETTQLRDDRIAVYGTDGNFYRDLAAFVDPLTQAPTDFVDPQAVALDTDGDLYMRDSFNIYKFDSNLTPIVMWSIDDLYGPVVVDTQCGELETGLQGLTIDSDKNLYSFWSIWGECYNGSRIVKFSQEPIVVPSPVDPVPDRDGDGLSIEEERLGWIVTYSGNPGITAAQLNAASPQSSAGSHAIHVTSDPSLADTDADGLTDGQERDLGSNPQDPDTDHDGLGDFDDPNPLDYDTDKEGLPDGVEAAFGSDPQKADSDGDGLSDWQEFQLKSDPNNADTDKDGVSDGDEQQDGTDLFNPDSDGDFMFDGGEKNLGTDPLSGDSDGDGLPDGDENLHNTDPKNGDSDGDGIEDGTEVQERLDPTSNDTDRDGIPDGIEREQGTDPFRKDSDRDGIPDNLDDDSDREHVPDLILVMDPGEKAASFAEKLKRHTLVQIATIDELLSNDDYRYAHRIVLVGKPDGGNPVGSLIGNLLSDTGDVLTGMMQSEENRLAVRHGIWTPEQSVVMISTPQAQDHLRALDIFRSKRIAIQPDQARIKYTKSLSAGYKNLYTDQDDKTYIGFLIDEIDTLKQTDGVVGASLNEDVMPVVELTRYNSHSTPSILSSSNGLDPGERDLGQYLKIEMGEDADAVNGTLIRIYYRLASIDRNGDGDLDDPEDINETTLSLYHFDPASQKWTRLDEQLDWVHAVTVNTTDIQLYGNDYAGYIESSVAGHSLFAVAGQLFNRPPDVSNSYPSRQYLWPPNHKMVEISIEGVTDPDGDPVQITIVDITSNEPQATTKSKKHSVDFTGIGTDTAHLRAERYGKGDGRVYTVTFIASDGRGGESQGTVEVFVEKNRGTKRRNINTF